MSRPLWAPTKYHQNLLVVKICKKKY
jgi:hypothetical protein